MIGDAIGAGPGQTRGKQLAEAEGVEAVNDGDRNRGDGGGGNSDSDSGSSRQQWGQTTINNK